MRVTPQWTRYNQVPEELMYCCFQTYRILEKRPWRNDFAKLYVELKYEKGRVLDSAIQDRSLKSMIVVYTTSLSNHKLLPLFPAGIIYPIVEAVTVEGSMEYY